MIVASMQVRNGIIWHHGFEKYDFKVGHAGRFYSTPSIVYYFFHFVLNVIFAHFSQVKSFIFHPQTYFKYRETG